MFSQFSHSVNIVESKSIMFNPKSKKLIICFSGTFSENDVGGWLFILFLLIKYLQKRCMQVNSRTFLTFSMCSHQLTNKMVANDGHIELTISDVLFLYKGILCFLQHIL